MAKTDVVLVFGESPNDRAALKEIASALSPKITNIQVRREPLVLIKNRKAPEASRAADKIARVVRADAVRSNIAAVIAHEDCDAVEPAHEAVAATIEANLKKAGVPNPIAATPAYELETWLYQWPDAVAAVCTKWRRINRSGQSVGGIVNAKEQLRRDLRPTGKNSTAPEYEERHSAMIAAQVKRSGCVDKKDAKSQSFDAFAVKLRELFK